MAGAHRYCCRVSHRPALVSRSLVASTRTMLMKRMKLSCGVRGAESPRLLAGRGKERGGGCTHGPAQALLCHSISRGSMGLRLPH